jgi:hypothetical protein
MHALRILPMSGRGHLAVTSAFESHMAGCRSPMKRQIAPGFRSRAPGHACHQSQTAIPFNNHQDAVRVESPLTENSAELSIFEQTLIPMSAVYIGCRALEGFMSETDQFWQYAAS